MFKNKTIADRHVGVVFGPTGFEGVLESGNHYVPSSKTLHICNQADFPAQVPQLEWLSVQHADRIAPYIEVVRTGVDEIAMASCAQKHFFIQPNSWQGFWKKDLPVEIRRTRIGTDLRVPDDWVAVLPTGISQSCVKQVSVPATGFGLLFTEENFCDFLPSGRHAYFDVLPKTRLVLYRHSQVIEDKDVVRSVLASGHAALDTQLALLETSDQELALCWDQQELVHVCGTATQALVSTQLRVETVVLGEAPRSLEDHVLRLMRTSAAAAKLLAPHVNSYEVASEHVGMFHVDGVFREMLAAGFYVYWHGGKRLSLTAVDTRLTTLEIGGQEMLTQDKVQLRVNVTAGYKIVDARQVTSCLNDYKDFIYKEIQFALRAAIGSRTLDGLLEHKNETDEQILGYMREKAAAQGIEIVSLGIKDLILPGEIKAILGKVVEAEKAAQANVIRRREETAATRSLMNTARVMEDNPVALRLKELETLEKITEKIEHLNVYGGLEGLLKQLVPLKAGGGDAG